MFYIFRHHETKKTREFYNTDSLQLVVQLCLRHYYCSNPLQNNLSGTKTFVWEVLLHWIGLLFLLGSRKAFTSFVCPSVCITFLSHSITFKTFHGIAFKFYMNIFLNEWNLCWQLIFSTNTLPHLKCERFFLKFCCICIC